ncbi:hypothetical protein GJ496_009152 [Pomphorhynchus laevis]|nr:hypothetical protein GJ496_009152 [Pomphorhynchus laevis]
MEYGNIRGAVRTMCSTFLSYHNATHVELLRLHQMNKSNTKLSIPAVELNRPLSVVTVKSLLSVLNSFPFSSARGPDGLTFMHMRDLLVYTAGPTAGILLLSLTKLLSVIMSGKVYTEIAQTFR